jgi:hypothetical protein
MSIIATIARLMPALALSLLASGCLLDQNLAVNAYNSQTTGATVNGSVDIASCSGTDNGASKDVLCPTLAGDASTIVSAAAELVMDLAQLDPLILEVPASASGFAGLIRKLPGGPNVPLVITPGLVAIPVDLHTTMVAEPGMQFVIVDFPDGTPPGFYTFSFGYNVSAAPTIKVMSTIKAHLGGTTYYLPMLPCVTDFANVPSVSALTQNYGGFGTPIATVLVGMSPCHNKVYDLGGGAAATPVDVVEFYNASLDHYFITWVPNEIAILDAGTQIKGWTRTGLGFKAYSSAVAGTSPVCRFYIPPALGDSHFFGRGQAECDETASKFPQLVLEDAHFMYLLLPAAGACPAGTVEVHRVFSDRADANHRYFTDPAVGTQMIARHWLPEGDGPDLVVMCAPA